MSGFGVICNCCEPSLFNACSFESDGTLRWAVRWSAIEGSANGGMDVFDYAPGRGTRRQSIHVIGTRLVAVGTKSGNIYVAALNLTDGSEALPLTDTGQAFNTNIRHGSEQYTRVIGSTIVFGGVKGSGTSQRLERYAVTNAGGITTTESADLSDKSSGAAGAYLAPSGDLVGRKQKVDSSWNFKSINGTTGNDNTSIGVVGFLCLGSDTIYIEETVVGQRQAHKQAVPVGAGFTGVSTAPATSWPSLSSGYVFHHIDDTNDRFWLLGTSSSNALRIFDIGSDSQVLAVAFSSTSLSSIGDAHIGPDGAIYLVPLSGGMSVTRIDSSGNVSAESESCPGDIQASGDAHVWSDASGKMTASWKVSVDDACNIARWSENSGQLDREWLWSGAPRVCPTSDGSGNLYFANINGDLPLPISNLLRHEILDLTSTVSDEWDVPSPSGLDKTNRYDSTPSATTPISTVPPDRNTAQEWNLETVSVTYADNTITATVWVYVGVADESATLDAQLFVDGAWTTAVELSWTSGAPGWVSAVLASNLSNADFSSHKLRLTTNDPIGIEEFEAIYVELTGNQ